MLINRNKLKEILTADKFGHPWWEWILDTIMVTTLTLFFVWIVLSFGFNGDWLKALPDIDDAELIDLYTLVDHQSENLRQSPTVVVAIDGCSRQEVTTALQMLSQLAPRSIGVDVSFPFSADDDERLMETICGNDCIVMASYPKKMKDGGYEIGYGSYFDELLCEEGVKYGSVLLDIDSHYDIVRTFTPALLAENDTVWSLEVQMVRMAGVNIQDIPLTHHPYINYPPLLIDTLPCADLVAENVNIDSIRQIVAGKFVLIGDLNAPTDLHRTPIHAEMAGVMIHAYILDTILYGRLIRTSPESLNWFIAFLLCAIGAGFLLYCKWKWQDAEGLVLRIAQLVLMLFVVVGGVLLFACEHFYFDLAPAFLALALQTIALDVWVGIMELCKKRKQSKKK